MNDAKLVKLSHQHSANSKKTYLQVLDYLFDLICKFKHEGTSFWVIIIINKLVFNHYSMILMNQSV